MGEVLASTDGTPELMMRSEDRTNDGGGDSAATTTNNVVRWDKFLPKMTLRVLLVEADDSTRQIITALLRKCSYKVAAVSDGLKAWEVLKERSKNIDLILTEVELPSISGFALLTLIMEHQVCKNIPVIMMSAHDSVSTVYKCMLRGAADFLVKPVRKNELKNLWQHVWRRQASSNGPQEEQKVEATAENNATSNRSSGYMACVKQNRECIEKGSDAQSSCTKPDMEADAPPMEQSKDLPLPEGNMISLHHDHDDDMQHKADTSAQEKDITTSNTCREAIDLIGSFDSYPKPSYKSSLNKVDHPSPMLDLSLRRSHPSSSVNQFTDDRHRLKQSDVSAFSRYINRTQPPLASGSTSISNQHKDCEANSDKPLSKNAMEYNSDTHSAPVGTCQRQHGLAESQSQFPSPKQRVFPVPVPVPVRACALPPPFSVEPCSSGHQANPYYISAPQPTNDSHHMVATDQTETLEDRGHPSSATDHSASSSFCNGGGTLTRLNSTGSGGNAHVNLPIDRNGNGNGNGNGNITHRSIQREAALNKFRLKRKDRCYDKKVRYESRKKLAEQRPRVKGQFVRQGQTSNPSPTDAQ